MANASSMFSNLSVNSCLFFRIIFLVEKYRKWIMRSLRLFPRHVGCDSPQKSITAATLRGIKHSCPTAPLISPALIGKVNGKGLTGILSASTSRRMSYSRFINEIGRKRQPSSTREMSIKLFHFVPCQILVSHVDDDSFFFPISSQIIERGEAWDNFYGWRAPESGTLSIRIHDIPSGF